MEKPDLQISISNVKGYETEIKSRNHFVIADESTLTGGSDKGLNPYELLLSALGSCKAITMRMYAQRKNIPLGNISINLYHEKIHAEDCLQCEAKEGKIDKIEVEINLTGQLNNEERKKLLDISEKCPVHRTLISEIKINTS
ncbi:MAG: OsmC family protein [Bacteroidota bacterium]|nr:OsmC family protein [Bacteroidota bacterium]